MTEEASGPTVLRILLGTQLRRLREARGITAQEAAKTIRASESKISRIELGRNAFRELDVADLLTLYGITDLAEREQMLALANQANQPGWWHRYQDILPTWFQAYIGLEESAESIRSYDAQFVPGLLQTEEYAAAVIELGEFSLEGRDPAQLIAPHRDEHEAEPRHRLRGRPGPRRGSGNHRIKQRQRQSSLRAFQERPPGNRLLREKHHTPLSFLFNLVICLCYGLRALH